MIMSDETLAMRLTALEQQVQGLVEENRRLRQGPATSHSGSRMSRRGLFLGASGLVGAAAGGALLKSSPAAAASPSTTINYQGRLTDAQGTPISAGTVVYMSFALYNSPSPQPNEVPVWSEPSGGGQIPVTIQNNGLFNYYLGTNTSLPTTLLSQPLYLEIKVGLTVMAPREQVGSFPRWMVQAGQPNGVASLDANAHVTQGPAQGVRQRFMQTQTYDDYINLNSGGTSWYDYMPPGFSAQSMTFSADGTGILFVFFSACVGNFAASGTNMIKFRLITDNSTSDNSAIYMGGTNVPAGSRGCFAKAVSGGLVTGSHSFKIQYNTDGGNFVCRARASNWEEESSVVYEEFA